MKREPLWIRDCRGNLVERRPLAPVIPSGPDAQAFLASLLIRRADWESIGDRVYFIDCNAEFVKIGSTAVLSERLKAHRISNPYPINVVAVLRGNGQLETAVHRHFTSLRRSGEWFQLAGSLREFLTHPAVVEARAGELVDVEAARARARGRHLRALSLGGRP